MNRYVVVGNSASGKSTLARRLAAEEGLAHLDLDMLAWDAGPRRRDLAESTRQIERFMDAHGGWVIEGCYEDLAKAALSRCTRFLFLDPGIETCIARARARPWEPHKYRSKEEQDQNLAMLINWIRGYETRDDALSRKSHQALFDGFGGDKAVLR
jgi:adenylate kinase family enzyme